MAKLTSERCNGIKTGYWSAAKKDELVQKLGAIEHRFDSLATGICEEICKHPEDISLDQDGLDEICDRCPLNALEHLILEVD